MKVFILKQALTALLCTTTPALLGYQSRYQRLMLKDTNGHISKTVDVISDAHIPLKKLQTGENLTNLHTHETSLFTPSERTLIDTIRDISQSTDREKVEIILEYSPEQKSSKKPEKNFFLEYLGKTLTRVIPADTYRRIDNKLQGDLFHVIEQPENYLLLHPEAAEFLPMISWAAQATKAHEPLYFIQNLIDNPYFGQKDRLKIATQNKRHTRICNWLWRTHINWLKQEYNYFFPTEIDSNLSLNQLITQLKNKDIYTRFIEKLWVPALITTHDLELLIKLLGSDREHIIIIAGAFHCDNLTSYLTTLFDFKELINLGSKTTVHYPQSSNTYDWFWHKAQITGGMQPDVWKYLKESPEQSLKNFEDNGKIKALVDTHFWHAVHTNNLTQDQINLAQKAHIDFEIGDYYEIKK